MFEIKKTFEISAAHWLDLPYESKCSNIHGHNFTVVVYCRATELNASGMVLDFTTIKKSIQEVLDHKYLNDIEDIGFIVHQVPSKDDRVAWKEKKNPTAERIAEWICHQIKECYQVDVQESEGNVAIYIDDSKVFNNGE
jgi:6-pyruvoyltetrahydropterin/6-carboxytetrahydropterin synthase